MLRQFFVDVKAQYLLLETKIWGMETELRRFEKVARGAGL